MDAGCQNCYAERIAGRFAGPGKPYEGLIRLVGSKQVPQWNGQVKFIEDHLDDPLRWERPRLVFVNSMSDLFHEALADEQIDRIVNVMGLARQHTFQVLTKRPERMADYLASRAQMIRDYGPVHTHLVPGGTPWPLPNVWWGTSASDQPTLDAKLQHLMACRQNAAVLWLSLEPLTGPVTLKMAQPFLAHLGAAAVECQHGFDACPECDRGIDWVVVGGESGPKARPIHPDWVRQLRDECLQAHVPFHFKQWGEYQPSGRQIAPRITERKDISGGYKGLRRVIWPGGQMVEKVGKKAAGRLLDRREHNDMPAMPAGSRD